MLIDNKPYIGFIGGGSSSGPSAGKETDAYSYQAKSETATHVYWFFEDGDGNWYIRRKNNSTGVHSFSKGIDGYITVYVNATTAPWGTLTWGTYDQIFEIVGVTSPLSFDSNGSLNVNVTDPHSETLLLYLHTHAGTFTITSNVALGDDTFTATGGHGITVGDFIVFKENSRYFQSEVASVANNVIGLNSPFDYAFTTLANCYRGITNMAVDGSSSPVIFGCSPRLLTGVKWHITSLSIEIMDNATMDDSLFGGISRLAKGVHIRKTGTDIPWKNIATVRTNGGLRMRGDHTEYVAKAPSGYYSLIENLTLGGADNNGTIIELDSVSEDWIQVIVRDNLSALYRMRVLVKGNSFIY